MDAEVPLGSTPEELVESFTVSETRYPAYAALQGLGDDALAAIHDGLGHGNWQVRKWCAMYLDHHTNDESFVLLKPLLRDPKMDVRLWATHSISCERCKEGECPVDFVPLLIERIEMDESIRVRRMAVCMLSEAPPDKRALSTLQRIVAEEEDRKLLGHIGRELQRFRDAGLMTT
jgi:hypothetical protein